MRLNKKGYLIVGFILLSFVASPIIVNILMSFKVGPVYGDSPTWITFFGSYLGAVVSGLITILGVYMTIRFTQEQNRINLEVTRKLNAETLAFTQKESRLGKLPTMIHSLEECLDFLEECREDLEKANQKDIQEHLFVPAYQRTMNLFYINDAYHIVKKPILLKLTKYNPRKIRNFTVLADTSAYKSFVVFQNTLTAAYYSHISELESDYMGFQMDMMHTYFDEYDHVLISNESSLKDDIPLTEEDEMRMQRMKRDLYYKESEYYRDITAAYYELEGKLKAQLTNLSKEFSN